MSAVTDWACFQCIQGLFLQRINATSPSLIIIRLLRFGGPLSAPGPGPGHMGNKVSLGPVDRRLVLSWPDGTKKVELVPVA